MLTTLTESAIPINDAQAPARICKIAGRYLIFDYKEAAILRRQNNINGTLVGTAPQQPTQNIFLSLPIELRPAEAEALVDKNAAYIVDGALYHKSILRSQDSAAKKTYAQSLRSNKDAARRTFAEQNSKAANELAEKVARKKAQAKINCTPKATHGNASAVSPCDIVSHPSATESNGNHISQDLAIAKKSRFAITPTSSSSLTLPASESAFIRQSDVPRSALVRNIQCNGYYLTPGLRFGCMYSVYPGDPLRFHAHFMANEYGWEEQFSMLDIVGGGRLATAVKKAFLIGGQDQETGDMKTFSIEWACM